MTLDGVDNGGNSLIVEFAKVFELLELNSENKFKEILGQACPLIFGVKNNDYGPSAKRWEIFKKPLVFITNMDSTDPTSLIKTQLAVLIAADVEKPVLVSVINHEPEEDYYIQTPSELKEWHFEIEKIIPQELNSEPLILIYNTHNAETYKPSYGKSKEEGKNSGIVHVAQVFEETLEKQYGLKTIRSTVIHDYPDFTRSYLNSMNTVKEILKTNKKIQAVFDVHRDAGIPSKATTTLEINGKNIASIIIIIGTEHNNWRQNLAFAEKLEQKANELYPGLLRDVRLAANRRYNQNLHPHSLILEVGSDLNTLEEAKEGIKLFAQIVAAVLNAENN